MNKKLFLVTLRNTSLAVIYIMAVAIFMNNGDKIFGKLDSVFGPFVFLLLFSLSAAIVGGLVFGKAAMLFFDRKPKDGLRAALYSVGWLGLYTVITLALIAITYVPLD